MKKLLVVLMALLFTTGAFAQSTGAKFDYSLFGLAYGTMGNYGSADKWDYQHIRLRPMLSVGNQNIKGVVEFQIDQTYGASNGYDPDNYTAGSKTMNPEWGSDVDGAGILARNKAVKVRQAYLSANNVFMPGVGFITGLVAYYYPLVADIEAAVTGVSYDFGMGTASLYYVKINEDFVATKAGGQFMDDWNGTGDDVPYEMKNDVQAYLLDVSVKVNNIDIRPALAYATAEKGFAALKNLKAYLGAVNATGDMGMFDFDFTAAYLSYKTDKEVTVGTDLKKVKGGAYGVDLGVNVKPDPNMVVGIFGTYASGADKANKLGYYQAVDSLFDGGVPAGRLYMLQQGGTQDNGGYYPEDLSYGARVDKVGSMAFGLSAQYTLGKLVIFAQYGYVMSAKEKEVAGKKYDSIGQEIDAKISYEIAPKTNLFVEGAYIINGDDVFLYKSAKQVLWGLMTKI